MSGLYIAFSVLLSIISTRTTGAQSPTTQLKFYNSTTQLPHNNRIVPLGTTVLLECIVTTHQQQAHYNWACPHPPCDGEYRKVYNNLILFVATATTSGLYKCTPTPPGNEASATLDVKQSLTEGTLALYNRSKLLLQNTLITDPQQIPNGLVCTKGGSGGEARFRLKGGARIFGKRQGQSTTVESSQLNQNGRYVCFDGGRERPLFIYYSNATLPTPQVSPGRTSIVHLELLLTRPQGYNSGRFILRYDCGFRGIPIELEYRSAEISSSSSDVVVTRSRSCFVVGEVSRVTVWFVSGRHISSTPAVVNVTSGEVYSGPHTHPSAATTMASSKSTSTIQRTTATKLIESQPTTSDSSHSTPDPAQKGEPKESVHIELIAGVAAAAAILFLLLVLLIVVAVVLFIKCKRKANNSKGQAYSYVTHDTKGEKKDLMYDDIVPGGHGPPQDDASIGETHPIPLYADVEKTSKHNNNNTQGQPHPDEYDDIETPNTAHTVNNTSDQGPLPPGYEDLDAANTPHTEDKAGTEETPPEGGHVGDLYAVPDKSKKKNKEKKEKNKAASEISSEPTHYEPTADGEAGFDPNMLYAVVDKSQKKKK